MRGYRATHHLASQQLVNDKKPPPETPDGAESLQSQEPSVDRDSPSSLLPSRDSNPQTLTPSRYPIPKLPTLPHRVANLLCLPLPRRKSSSPRPSKTPSPLLRKAAFESLSRPQTKRYQSFPPPVFTGAGQPRALDNRLYAENLVDEYSYLDEEEEQYWRERPHSWADVVAARNRKQNPPNPSGSDGNEDKQQNSHTSLNAPPKEHPSPAPSTTLRLRGGGGGGSNRRKLKDDEPLPSLSWWLAGGQGAPPTAGSYEKWREREKSRIAEENRKTGRKGEGRGFWREMCWVLGGAKAVNYDRRRGKEGGAGAGAEPGGGGGNGVAGDAAGDGAAGGAAGDGAAGAGDAAAGGAAAEGASAAA